MSATSPFDVDATCVDRERVAHQVDAPIASRAIRLPSRAKTPGGASTTWAERCSGISSRETERLDLVFLGQGLRSGDHSGKIRIVAPFSGAARDLLLLALHAFGLLLLLLVLAVSLFLTLVYTGVRQRARSSRRGRPIRRRSTHHSGKSAEKQASLRDFRTDSMESKGSAGSRKLPAQRYGPAFDGAGGRPPGPVRPERSSIVLSSSSSFERLSASSRVMSFRP